MVLYNIIYYETTRSGWEYHNMQTILFQNIFIIINQINRNQTVKINLVKYLFF